MVGADRAEQVSVAESGPGYMGGPDACSLIILAELPKWLIALVIMVSIVFGAWFLSDRKVVRSSLDKCECPQCRGPLRHYPGEETSYYCRTCTLGFTDRGKTVRADAD